MKALLIIDVQNDFLPGGALAVPDGQQILPVVNQLIPKFDLVVATQDWHPADHQSFASQHPNNSIGDVIELAGLRQILWPDHCVQGSKGAEFASALNVARIQNIIQKGTDREVDSYSGFFDNARRKETGLENCLREQDVDDLHIVGLATDYCVKFTALDAAQLGFQTTVHAEGVRGVNIAPYDSRLALKSLADAGVKII